MYIASEMLSIVDKRERTHFGSVHAILSPWRSLISMILLRAHLVREFRYGHAHIYLLVDIIMRLDGCVCALANIAHIRYLHDECSGVCKVIRVLSILHQQYMC